MKLSVSACALILSICLPSEFSQLLKDDILHHNVVHLFPNTIGSNFLFILYSSLYFTYLWNPFDSYHHPVKQRMRSLSKREKQHEGRSRCCERAAILQMSLIISKSERLATKTKHSHCRQPSPLLVFSFSIGTYGVVL